MTFFGGACFSEKNKHPEKTFFKLGYFFERNPLPGSAPARHLELDALILTRFGGLRGRISHKTCFLKIWVPYVGPKCSGAGMFTVISRNGSVEGTLVQNNLTGTKDTWPYIYIYIYIRFPPGTFADYSIRQYDEPYLDLLKK